MSLGSEQLPRTVLVGVFPKMRMTCWVVVLSQPPLNIGGVTDIEPPFLILQDVDEKSGHSNAGGSL